MTILLCLCSIAIFFDFWEYISVYLFCWNYKSVYLCTHKSVTAVCYALKHY